MKYQKGDCRAHGPLHSVPLTMNPLVTKRRMADKKNHVDYGYAEPGETNRHERRREKALIRRYSPSFLKGKPTASIIRRMVRTQGLGETLLMMRGKA